MARRPLLLLDGLDEVGPSLTATVLYEIESIAREKLDIIVSSRPQPTVAFRTDSRWLRSASLIGLRLQPSHVNISGSVGNQISSLDYLRKCGRGSG